MLDLPDTNIPEQYQRTSNFDLSLASFKLIHVENVLLNSAKFSNMVEVSNDEIN